jgi:transposase
MTTPKVDPGRLPSPPDPEVPEKAKRRRFSAEYKLAILREAEAAPSRARSVRCCAASGWTPPTWSTGAANPSRGAPGVGAHARPKPADPAHAQVERLRRANERLAQAPGAGGIIQIQGKVSELLGLPLDPASDDEQSASS